MPTIIMVRHGESVANKDLRFSGEYADPQLTELGHIQAKITAKYLVRCFEGTTSNKIIVWTSPFLRTIQTAEPFIKLAGNMVRKVESIQLLQEYTTSNNSLTPHLRKDFCIQHKQWSDFTNQLFLLNELLRETYYNLKEDETLIIFGHSLVISTLLTYYISGERVMNTCIDDTSIQIPNCAITCLKPREETSWLILATGSISHLPAKFVTGSRTPFNVHQDVLY